MTFNADTTVELCNEDVDLPSVKFDFTKINELDSKTPGNQVGKYSRILVSWNSQNCWKLSPYFDSIGTRDQ